MQALEQKNIDNLCFVGGGAKGITYTGSYEVLHELGIVSGLKAVAGTSVGALTAFLVAIGTSPNDLRKQMSENNLPDLLGKGEFQYLGMQKDGKPLNDFLLRNIKDELQKTFDSNPNLDHLSEQERQVFSDLKDNFRRPDYEPSMVDLAIMRKVNPEKYKDLAVATVHRKSQTLHIFSSLEQTVQIKKWLSDIKTDKEEMLALKERSQESSYEFTAADLALIKAFDQTKDFHVVKNKEGKNEILSNVSIIKACMASAALPVVLKNVRINGERFTDGGLIKNMPFDILPNQEGMLMLAFNGDALQKAIHGNDEKPFEHNFLTWLLHYILRRLGVLVEKPFEETKNEELKSVRESAALKTVPNDVGGINVGDFKKAQKQKDEMYLRGYLGTMNHLILYNKHPKAAQIVEKEFELLAMKKAGMDTSALDAEIDSLSKDFAKFRKEFEMRKFCFEVIDTKGLSRKTPKYRDLLDFCMDKSNFENKDLADVAKKFMIKLKGDERTLVSALNDPRTSSEEIRKAFSEALKLGLKPRENFTVENIKKSWIEKIQRSDNNRPQQSI